MPSELRFGFEYKTLNRPFVSIFGLVMAKLTRKKPPKATIKTIKIGDIPISEKESKKILIIDPQEIYSFANKIKEFLLQSKPLSKAIYNYEFSAHRKVLKNLIHGE